MLQQVTKDNFNQLLNRFSTNELETLLVKFPFFQQAHLLLAKKYQLELHPKFDQQLQLAALYTNDRELFYSLFNDKESTLSMQQPVSEPVVTTLQPAAAEELSVTSMETIGSAEVTEPLSEPVVDEPVTQPTFDIEEEPTDPFESTKAVVATTVEQSEEPAFDVTQLHTFSEWLHAFSKTATAKVVHMPDTTQQQKMDEELEKLYVSNIPVNLQELVEEETHYSKGLDIFIAKEIAKRHRSNETRQPKTESELLPELVTETMAKVYELQKKYTKAIECYRILTLKYPEKSDLFAARINYLKNIL